MSDQKPARQVLVLMTAVQAILSLLSDSFLSGAWGCYSYFPMGRD